MLIPLATSLVPKTASDPYTLACLRSWRLSGCAPLSFHSAPELADLTARGTDPGIALVEAPTGTTDLYAKPLVALEDIFGHFGRQDSGFTLTNADILFAKNFSAPAMADLQPAAPSDAASGGGMLVVSRRKNFTRSMDEVTVYEHGFDLFHLSRRLPDTVPRRFCLGVPWWDYLVPVACLLRGFTLVQFRDPPIYHRDDAPVAWSMESWVQAGVDCAAFLTGILDTLPPLPAEDAVFADALRRVHGAGSAGVDQDTLVHWLHALSTACRGLIDRRSRWIEPGTPWIHP